MCGIGLSGLSDQPHFLRIGFNYTKDGDGLTIGSPTALHQMCFLISMPLQLNNATDYQLFCHNFSTNCRNSRHPSGKGVSSQSHTIVQGSGRSCHRLYTTHPSSYKKKIKNQL